MSPWFAEINEHPVKFTVFRYFEEGVGSVTLHLEWKQSGVSLFCIGYEAPKPLFRALDWLLPCKGENDRIIKGWCRKWRSA